VPVSFFLVVGGDGQRRGREKPARLTTKWKVHPMEPLRNFPPEPGEISLDDWRERVLEQRDEARWVLAAERRARVAAQQDGGFNLEVPPLELPEPQWGRPKSEHRPDDPGFDPGILMPYDSLPNPGMPTGNSAELGCDALWADIEEQWKTVFEIKDQIKLLHQQPENEQTESTLDDLLVQLEAQQKKLDEMESNNLRYCSA